MICWSCQVENPDDAKFCLSCGSKLRPEAGVEAPCRSCGAPLPLEARFCGYCGTPEPIAVPSAEATEAAKPSEALARAIAGTDDAAALAYDEDDEDDDAELDRALGLEDEDADAETFDDEDDEEATIVRPELEERPLVPPEPVPRPKQPTEPARVASVRTLQRLFDRHVGVSPAFVIRRWRLIEAAEAAAMCAGSP